MTKRMLAVYSALISLHTSFLDSSTAYFSIRSQSVNAARDLVGWQQYINRCSGFHGALSITPEFTESFRTQHLARCLFGQDLYCDPSCGSSIKVSGTAVQDRGEHDWLADYFGLPRDFQSTLIFSPRVQNFLVDVGLYLGFSNGIYLRAHAPIVNTRWSLHFKEEAIIPGVLPDDPGYFDASSSADGTPRSDLVADATAFFTGVGTPTLQDVTFQPLKFSKFSDACHCLSETKLSDVEFAAGWNFWRDDCHVIGMSIRASAPTGNKPRGVYFFEPMVGSGGNWKLGMGLNAQTQFWTDEKEEHSVWFYLDAHIQHLFAARQRRVFDLCGKPNSRYMLAQKLGTKRQPIHLIGSSDAGVEFQSEFAPVANITASVVKVSAKVEADIAVKISYNACYWTWDFGYNFWGRSCERIRRCPVSSDPLDGATWALKGDAHIIGFADVNVKTPVNLAAVEAGATINNGTNNFVGPNLDDGGVNGIRPTANPGITNPQLLVGANGATGDLNVNDRISPIDGIPTRSSNPVAFISTSNVDFVGTKGFTHKIFTHFNHGWQTTQSRITYLGFGAEIEFNHKNGCGNDTPCRDSNCSLNDCELFCPKKKKKRCPDCVLNQWGVWLKGGVAFK